MSRIEKSLEKAIKLRSVSTPVIRKEPLSPDIARSYYAEDEKQAHLRDYLEIMLRRKWIVIVFLSTVVLIGTLASFLMTPLYLAGTTIQMGGVTSRIITKFQEAYRGEDDLETQYNILTSMNLAERVKAKLPSEISYTPSGIDSLKNALPFVRKTEKRTNKDEITENISVGTILKGLEVIPVKKSPIPPPSPGDHRTSAE